VALAVSASYLQLIATAARIDTSKAQIETAKAVYKQAFDRDKSGLAAHIDVNRSRVELQTQQERLTSLHNELEKQRIAFARLIGMPMAQPFTLSDAVPYHEAAIPDLNELIQRAFAHRADVQSAEAQVKAGEAAHHAAIEEYLPSIQVNADYGALGITPTNMDHGTYTVVGGVQFPIFRSGRIQADIAQEDAALRQRKAELEDQKARAEQDVRDAFLDLQTAMEQIAVTESNRSLAAETLQQARDRFRAGVADTVELVQAQESVATSEQDYITALFSLNLAQVSLARAVGETEQGIVRLLQGK
jgi:outer membrane protein TolC